MKSHSVPLALACFLTFICQLQAASEYTQLTPATVKKQSRSFTITVDRFKDEKKGEYLRFNVKVKAKPGEVPLSPFLSTDLEVFDGETVVCGEDGFQRLHSCERDASTFLLRPLDAGWNGPSPRAV